jgi:hypothetical protein
MDWFSGEALILDALAITGIVAWLLFVGWRRARADRSRSLAPRVKPEPEGKVVRLHRHAHPKRDE